MEVRVAQVGAAEVRAYKVGTSKIYAGEFLVPDYRFLKLWAYVWMALTPSIPNIDALVEYFEMAGTCHVSISMRGV